MAWNNLAVDIRNSASCNVFKIILKFTRLNQVFNADISEGLKFLQEEDLHLVT